MSGTTHDATAAIPKKTDPSMFRPAICNWVPRRPHTAASASPLARRKQMEPRASGAHTRTSSWAVESASFMAVKVVTLKNTVPTSCTLAAHQSRRSRRAVWLNWSREAVVKKIEPAKNVTPTTSGSTSSE